MMNRERKVRRVEARWRKMLHASRRMTGRGRRHKASHSTHEERNKSRVANGTATGETTQKRQMPESPHLARQNASTNHSGRGVIEHNDHRSDTIPIVHTPLAWVVLDVCCHLLPHSTSLSNSASIPT